MTLVKSNLCPTCGGLLNIDLDKQIYVCPFCGVTFDYEYFSEDNVKKVASKSINRSEYGSAKDAYDFMLTKDPHDFEALRGLFICKNRWQSMDIMTNDSEVHVSTEEPTLLSAIKNSLPKHRPYFEKVREALLELDHYRDLSAEALDIDKNKTAEREELAELKEEYYYNSRQFTELCHEVADLNAKEREAVVTFCVLIPIFIVGVLIWNRAWPLLIFLASIAAAVIGSYHIMKAVNAHRLRARMVPVEKKLRELTEQYEAKSAEADQSHNRYKTLVQEFTDMDPMPRKAEKKDPADEDTE